MIAPVTRSELTPFIAIAFHLRARGWSVAICAADSHHDRLRATNVFDSLVPLQWPADQLCFTPAFAAAYLGASASLVDQAQLDGDLANRFNEANWRAEYVAAVSFGATAILAAITAVPDALTIGQRLNAPAYILADRPFADSTVLQPVTVAGSQPATINKLLHWGTRQWRQLDIGDRINRFRVELGLGDPMSFKFSRLPQLLVLDEAFLSRPSDYGANIAMPGFATLPPALLHATKLDAALAAFLDTDAAHYALPPVFVSFGDMPAPDGTLECIVQTLAKLKMRAIVAGRIGMTESRLPPHVHVCDAEPPLELILPHCCVAVLAGEPADVSAALVTGCPVLALWITPVQRFFAERLVSLYAHNVAHPERVAMPLAALDGPRFTNELTFLVSEEVRQRATALAKKHGAGEPGAAAAAQWIEARYQRERFCGVGMRDGGWQRDDDAPVCTICKKQWNMFTNRRHHCRACGVCCCADCLALDTVPNFNDDTMLDRVCFEARAYLRETGRIAKRATDEQQAGEPDDQA
jgi:hypothetical protein